MDLRQILWEKKATKQIHGLLRYFIQWIVHLSVYIFCNFVLKNNTFASTVARDLNPIVIPILYYILQITWKFEYYLLLRYYNCYNFKSFYKKITLLSKLRLISSGVFLLEEKKVAKSPLFPVLLQFGIVHEAERIPVVDVVDVAKHAREPVAASVVHEGACAAVIPRQILRIDELVDLAHVVSVEKDLRFGVLYLLYQPIFAVPLLLCLILKDWVKLIGCIFCEYFQIKFRNIIIMQINGW